MPLSLVNNGLDEILVKRLRLKASPLDISDWREMVDRIKHPKHEVRIAVVGKYMKHRDAYKSVYESLDHAGIANRTRVLVVRGRGRGGRRPRGRGDSWAGVDGILVPGGFGMRGIEGKIEAIRYARTQQHPVSSASAWECSAPSSSSPASVLGLDDANSTEFDQTTAAPGHLR